MTPFYDRMVEKILEEFAIRLTKKNMINLVLVFYPSKISGTTERLMHLIPNMEIS